MIIMYLCNVICCVNPVEKIKCCWNHFIKNRLDNHLGSEELEPGVKAELNFEFYHYIL